MKRIVAAVLLLTSFPMHYGGQQPPAPTVLQHVTVVNEDSPPMSDMTILIIGGRIAAMGRADAITNIRNVTRIHKVIKGGIPYEPVDPSTSR